MRALRLLSVVFAACLSIGVVLAETDLLKDVKCIISSEAINKDAHSKWKEGQVYFCCEKCQAKFDEKKEDFANKANAQLVASHQYEQGACPLTGGKLNKDTAIKVDGASIAFCCNNCKGKAEKMDKETQVKDLFNDKAFEKAKFVKVEEKKK